MLWLLVIFAFVAGIQSAISDEPIPFSGGRGQIFASSDDLIKSFHRQHPKSPELPAVVLIIGSHLRDRIPITEVETLEPSILSHKNLRSAPKTPVIEQNSTSKSMSQSIIDEKSLIKPTESHETPNKEDSQLKPASAPFIPLVIPVQVWEVFTENSHSVSEPQTDGQSLKLPNIVKVQEEDSETLTELAPHGQIIQWLSDHVWPFIPTTLTLVPIVALDQSVQHVPNRPQILQKQKSTADTAQQNSGQSHVPEQVKMEQKDTLSTNSSEEPPARPNFDRSLHLRDDISVPGWHKDSNTARTIVDNSTVIYRKLLLDGRIQYLKIKPDRTNGSEIRRCTMSPPLEPTSPENLAVPGLPEMAPFRFVGYTTEEGRSQVEHWQYVVLGRPGENGAREGDSLNVTHDFFAFRDGSDAVPLRYTVTTDSLVLGPVFDTYSHRYRALPAPTAAILPNATRDCDVWEELKDDRRRAAKLLAKILD